MLWKIGRVLGVLGLVAFIGGHTYKRWFRVPSQDEAQVAAKGPAMPAEVIGRRFVSWALNPQADAEIVLRGPTETSFGTGIIELPARDLKLLGSWMALDPASRWPRRDVVLVYESMLIDRYGAEIVRPVLVMRWARADWERIAWETITPELLMALGRPQAVHPAVRNVLALWCEEGAPVRRSAPLCRES